MPDLILRQLLADGYSLGEYLGGGSPKHEDVLRHLLVTEHHVDNQKPDYIYRKQREKYLAEDKSIDGIIISVFDNITNKYLFTKSNVIYIKDFQFASWQDLLPRIPPLALVAFKLYKEFGVPEKHYINDDYVKEKLVSNIGKTTLPSPYFPQLETLIKNEGLIDLHAHLNGSTEFDFVWLHALKKPNEFYKSFIDITKDEYVKEQFEQVEDGLTSKKILDRIRLAGRLREMMVKHIYGIKSNLQILSTDKDTTERQKHPMQNWFALPFLCRYSPTVSEGLFYIQAFKYLEGKNKDDAFTHAFHLYLLLMGFMNKLLVQQVEQIGFDQFQKITLNELRDSSEKEYLQRFNQFSGRSDKDIALIEGRFSPKDTCRKNIKLLEKIISGFGEYQTGKKHFDIYSNDKIKLEHKLNLCLTAHFIKKDDSFNKKTNVFGIRHQSLRRDLEKQAYALLAAKRSNTLINKLLTGIDAASNELQTPPEVFAPIYRLLRRKGFKHFTYHAGEDFIHLVSGIRAVYEAAEFLGFERGDRIGHGTALGIDPQLWLDEIGDSVVLSKGEWLDNLIFSYSMLEGKEDVSCIRSEIEKLSSYIYKGNIYVPILIKAWKARHLDPLIVCFNNHKQTEKLYVSEHIEWDLTKYNNETIRLFRLY
ncbi:MAG: hypothetical protein KAJ75_07875, partial [Alphaproteobacteria bacterium]|nr:hypothetical protein [Alphaproteobacteria bacterium]